MTTRILRCLFATVVAITILTFVALLGTGCRTASQGSAGTTWLKPERVQAIATLATYSGAVLDLRNNPNHREQWQVAYDGLLALSNQEAWTVEHALLVISGLPIKFFESSEGNLTLTGVMLLSDAFGLGEFDAKRDDHARAVIAGLRKGIGMALAQPTTKLRSVHEPLAADLVLEHLRVEAELTR